MKIAVISDIHANLPALQSVIAHLDGVRPDIVVVGGDIINRGPQPRECLEIILDNVRDAGWRLLKGNHEDYVLHAARGTRHLPSWEQALCAHSAWTAAKICDYLPLIASWPDFVEVPTPDGAHLTCFHASRKGNRVGLYEFMQDGELLEHITHAPSALCVGHTHIPFIRYVEGKLIVNAGAVGMPFDHNPDASYALIQWSPEGWSAENIRVPYDRTKTIASYRSTGYIEEGGPMVPLILVELQQAASRLGLWHRRYESLVASGKMTLQESINLMLTDPTLT